MNREMMSAINKYYKICPTCGLFLNAKEQGEFCSSCGSTLIDQCPHCKVNIDDPYAKFCKHCGAAFRKQNVVVNDKNSN